ncbi:sperm-associated antigen 17-like [Xenia sp. Carnegie-2017]|uniref:sperm-associated antigen 17-like n=1 Tax=Xenia sp. Carnegie-2017 TaxID=2897299 RepID=UPI001F043B8D|nr:sperm-associated antigen 17-like [Xenia sp. Carnegie-2017]
MTSLPDDVDDQVNESMKLRAQWMTVTCDGQRFLQNDGGSQCLGNYVKQSLATCPDTRQIYKTREDKVIKVTRPDGTQVVEHLDGTRITTFYDITRVELQPPNAKTGEEAEDRIWFMSNVVW